MSKIKINRICRQQYLDKLISLRDKELIKVITGVRRCGKSTLMEIYQEYLLENGVNNEQIIAINLENFDYYDLHDAKKLHDYIANKLIDDSNNYIFLDEIQHCEDFPRVIDSLYLRQNVDLYITGSNAYMLSSQLATFISGRYIEINMLPFSFKEYMSAIDYGMELSKAYSQYIANSSFPYAIQLMEDKNNLHDYLSGIYNTVVVKDIMQRNDIADTMMFESITRFIFDNIGSKLSTKKISDTMTSNGRKINVRTVERYINYLMESYIVYQAKRYNIKGRQYLKTLDKYYVVDIGMRKILLGSKFADSGHILENVIYLELIRRGWNVYIGKVGDYEVDFVAMNSSEIKYFQVAATVRDKKTLERELRPLIKIKDNHEKILLTLDEDAEQNYDGIRIINALEWLVDN